MKEGEERGVLYAKKETALLIFKRTNIIFSHDNSDDCLSKLAGGKLLRKFVWLTFSSTCFGERALFNCCSFGLISFDDLVSYSTGTNVLANNNEAKYDRQILR